MSHVSATYDIGGIAMSTEQTNLATPGRIVKAAEAIYENKYKTDMEASHDGEFVAIDVLGEGCYLGDSAEAALQKARDEAPHGVFHLIRVGAPGAFSSSYGWGNESSVAWAL